MNSQEPNKYVRLKRARITKAVALTRKSVCPRATGLYLAQIQSRVKINEKIIHGETRSHFISFSSSKGPHTQKKALCVALSLFSLSLSLSYLPSADSRHLCPPQCKRKGQLSSCLLHECSRVKCDFQEHRPLSHQDHQ